MRVVSFDPSEPGLFAFGQHAVGVIAFGQLALGVVAVGQLARGVFAVGQLAVGVFSLGQLAVGLRHATGMIGAGADGWGLVLRWLPRAEPEPEANRPDPLEPDQLRQGQFDEGWIRGRVVGSDRDVSLVSLEGAPLRDVSITDPVLRTSLALAAGVGRREALVFVRVRRDLHDASGGYREGAVASAPVLEAVDAQTWEHWAPGRMGALRRELARNGSRVVLRAVLLLVVALIFTVVTALPLLDQVFGVVLVPELSRWSAP